MVIVERRCDSVLEIRSQESELLSCKFVVVVDCERIRKTSGSSSVLAGLWAVSNVSFFFCCLLEGE